MNEEADFIFRTEIRIYFYKVSVCSDNKEWSISVCVLKIDFNCVKPSFISCRILFPLTVRSGMFGHFTYLTRVLRWTNVKSYLVRLVMSYMEVCRHFVL